MKAALWRAVECFQSEPSDEICGREDMQEDLYCTNLKALSRLNSGRKNFIGRFRLKALHSSPGELSRGFRSPKITFSLCIYHSKLTKRMVGKEPGASTKQTTVIFYEKSRHLLKSCLLAKRGIERKDKFHKKERKKKRKRKVRPEKEVIMVVKLLESTMVKPAEPTPKHRQWLSNLDLSQARAYTPLVYFYRPNGDPSFFSAEKLSSSLAQVLVPFYPLAGRLAVDSDGRPEIDCSAEGVPFIVAQADCEMAEFKEFAPTPEMRRMFVPRAETADPPCALLMFQVTYLKCGAAILCAGTHHYANDGHFIFRFIQAWSAVARSAISAASLTTSIDRASLKARSPPKNILSCINSEYADFFPVTTNEFRKPLTNSVLRLDKNQLTNLRDRMCATSRKEHFTKFQIVASHIWRCICFARGLASDEEVKLALPIQVRQLVEPRLPDFYLGNVIMRITVSTVAGGLISDPIKFGAQRIKTAIRQVGSECVKSLIDYLEIVDVKRRSRRGELGASEICVVSWLGQPTHDADFGWGEPVFTGIAQLYGAGYIFLINGGSEKDGGVSVVLSLEIDCMERFKQLFYNEQTIRCAM